MKWLFLQWAHLQAKRYNRSRDKIAAFTTADAQRAYYRNKNGLTSITNGINYHKTLEKKDK